MHDPAFPALHIRPKQGWINDPNGLCRIDGIYHVFFQYNPDAPVHSNVHWGHVSSSDLIHWDEQPIALRPRPGQIDAAGCWSGCIVDDDGVPTAVYTANPGHAWDSTVGLARSDRALQAWTQSPDPVIGVPADLALDEVRDPFLFRIGGQRYAVQGAGQRCGRPMLLLYGCDDLEHWTELDPLLTDEDPIAGELAAANIWECPNLAYLDGQWVLIMSLWRWVDQTHELAGVRYFLGDLVGSGTGWKFKATGGGVLDDGLAFYAPQLMVDGDRTLLWGWAWELGRSEEWISDERLGRRADLPPRALRQRRPPVRAPGGRAHRTAPAAARVGAGRRAHRVGLRGRRPWAGHPSADRRAARRGGAPGEWRRPGTGPDLRRREHGRGVRRRRHDHHPGLSGL